MNTGMNTNYLTLALEVRKITDSLILLVEDGGELSEDLRRSVDPLIKSLTDQPSVSIKALSQMGPFGQFEGLSTIKEILQGERKRELVTKLQEALELPVGAREESALAAIRLLDSLERSALYHYENPRPGDRLAFAK